MRASVKVRRLMQKQETEFSVSLKNWNNGEIKLSKIPKGAIDTIKKEIAEKNNHLIKLSENLNALKSKINNALNNREENDVIDTDWLKILLTRLKRKI